MGQPFRMQLRVRFGECDPQGVVFNPNYLAFYDVALTELWREAIGPWNDLVAEGVDMVAAEAGVRWHAPARFDDELTLELGVTRLGTTALGTALRILRDDALLCEAWMRHVFVDARALTKTPMPEHIRAALEPYALAPEPAAESA
jgi:acyl-CoA thioester hydrolase